MNLLTMVPLLSQQSLFPLVTEKLKGVFDIKTWGSVFGGLVTGFLRVGVGQNIGESTDQTEVF